MKARKNDNAEGVLLTYQQVADRYNLGLSTVISTAKKAGALVKIGRAARVDPEAFEKYLDEQCREI